MDSIRPCPAPTKIRLAKKFQKFIHFKTSRRNLPSNGFCHTHQEKLKCYESHHFDKENVEEEETARNRAAMEAFLAKLFATISSVKAAYAELQIAQFPYNGEAMQSADQSIVSELKVLSELKQRFFSQKIDLAPPHLTLMLAEMQEQQSLMKTYEITMNKMQNEIERKKAQISSLQQELSEAIQNNKSLEMKLNASRNFSVLDSVKFSEISPKDFVMVLHYGLRSIRYFVKLLIREMESAKWDVDVAARAAIVQEQEVIFIKKNDKAFAFESFVCREIFGGFNEAGFSIKHDGCCCYNFNFIEQFKKLKSMNAIHFLKNNPTPINSISWFGEFLKSKYLQMVHPKMELSFFGNLNQRKLVNSGEYPETEFFKVFAEMGRRVWLLHCLAFSFNEKVGIFQAKKGCRYSEMYMESVTNELFADASAISDDIRVGFTVVPGFRFGKMVVQTQVYLSHQVIR